jgi:hypothetical protein
VVPVGLVPAHLVSAAAAGTVKSGQLVAMGEVILIRLFLLLYLVIQVL